MKGLSEAQRLYDRRLPDDDREREEREFESEDFPDDAQNVIRSSKFVDFKPKAEASIDGDHKTAGR